MTAIFVGEIVRFVKHNEVCADFTTAAQRVEELIAVDLCSADDKWRVGVFLAVAGQYPDLFGAEFIDELLILGIRERL